MSTTPLKLSEADLADLGRFVLEAFNQNRKLDIIMASQTDLTAKLNAVLPVLDAIKTDVAALKASAAASTDLETAVNAVGDRVAALRADVPTSGSGTTPAPTPTPTPLPGA